jgi:hypothetical protein
MRPFLLRDSRDIKKEPADWLLTAAPSRQQAASAGRIVQGNTRQTGCKTRSSRLWTCRVKKISGAS